MRADQSRQNTPISRTPFIIVIIIVKHYYGQATLTQQFPWGGDFAPDSTELHPTFSFPIHKSNKKWCKQTPYCLHVVLNRSWKYGRKINVNACFGRYLDNRLLKINRKSSITHHRFETPIWIGNMNDWNNMIIIILLLSPHNFHHLYIKPTVMLTGL